MTRAWISAEHSLRLRSGITSERIAVSTARTPADERSHATADRSANHKPHADEYLSACVTKGQCTGKASNFLSGNSTSRTGRCGSDVVNRDRSTNRDSYSATPLKGF